VKQKARKYVTKLKSEVCVGPFGTSNITSFMASEPLNSTKMPRPTQVIISIENAYNPNKIHQIVTVNRLDFPL